jgi:outer membrane protein OmpA-like peptidoglycan-associated protein
VLGDAVKVLKDYPDLKLEVSGHTSSDGKAETNQKLSQDRAESVKAYLVSAGIGGERIVAVGYGSDRSVADNKTKQGREMNRRIEFRLLTSDDTNAAPAAPAGGPPAEPIPTK